MHFFKLSSIKTGWVIVRKSFIVKYLDHVIYTVSLYKQSKKYFSFPETEDYLNYFVHSKNIHLNRLEIQQEAQNILVTQP